MSDNSGLGARFASLLSEQPGAAMVVRLRLSRHHWTRNRPRYNIVATNASDRTTAAAIEVLGQYDPIPTPALPPARSPNGTVRGPEWGAPQASAQQRLQASRKRIEWNADRIKYWLSVGAKPTTTVERLLNLGGIISQSYYPRMLCGVLNMGEQKRNGARYRTRTSRKSRPSRGCAKPFRRNDLTGLYDHDIRFVVNSTMDHTRLREGGRARTASNTRSSLLIQRLSTSCS